MRSHGRWDGRKIFLVQGAITGTSRVDAAKPLALKKEILSVFCSRYLKIKSELMKRLAVGRSYASKAGSSQTDVALLQRM